MIKIADQKYKISSKPESRERFQTKGSENCKSREENPAQIQFKNIPYPMEISRRFVRLLLWEARGDWSAGHGAEYIEIGLTVDLGEHPDFTYFKLGILHSRESISNAYENA